MRTTDDLPPHYTQAVALRLKQEGFWRYYREVDLLEDTQAGWLTLYRDVRVVDRFPLADVLGWERLLLDEAK